MWAASPIAIGLVLAIVIDYLIFRHNPARPGPTGIPEPKVYYPNLRIWGVGLIAGLAVFVATLFRHATDRLNTESLPDGVLWPRLAPSVYIVAVLALLVWGIVRLCRQD
jgi:hypothetical protein